MNRDKKILLLKSLQAGTIEVIDMVPAHLSIVFNFDELKEPYYYFINKKNVESDQYGEEFERQKQIFGNVLSEVFIGPGSGHLHPDVLPEYCKQFIKKNNEGL